MIEVWPVIHVKNYPDSVGAAQLARAHGCAGVFLISMMGYDDELRPTLLCIRKDVPDLLVGANYLGERLPAAAYLRSQREGFDATWVDWSGCVSGGSLPEGEEVARVRRPGHKFFAGVAFKGQQPDSAPGWSAKRAIQLGYIPTTSGPATGHAPLPKKIQNIRAVLNPSDDLAIASGLTPENIATFAPMISHALVATGISNENGFDPAKLHAFVENSRGSA